MEDFIDTSESIQVAISSFMRILEVLGNWHNDFVCKSACYREYNTILTFVAMYIILLK